MVDKPENAEERKMFEEERLVSFLIGYHLVATNFNFIMRETEEVSCVNMFGGPGGGQFGKTCLVPLGPKLYSGTHSLESNLEALGTLQS